jgi:short-subunit dehydrogenase involved in D-alanine esterification of teichoic acids
MNGTEVFADGVLAGRAVLVTGGGTGLGRAAAAELRRCGAEVVICGRRADVLAATAAELGLHHVAGDD